MDNVTPIREPARVGSILLDAETAPLLMELVTKAAVTGPQARLLADLYEQARKAVRDINGDAP